MAGKRGPYSSHSAHSSAVLRKAGVRLIRDARLNRRLQHLLGLLFTAFVAGLVFRKRLTKNPGSEPQGIASLNGLQPVAYASQPNNGACACTDAKHWRRVVRILEGASIVARIVFSKEHEVRVHTLFKGPPRLLDHRVLLDPASTFSCIDDETGRGSHFPDSAKWQNYRTGQHRISGTQDYLALFDDGGYDDGTDRSFLVAASIGQDGTSRRDNATILLPLVECNVIWAVQWTLLGIDVRESISMNPADGEPWWRDRHPWPPVEQEWWSSMGFGANASSENPTSARSDSEKKQLPDPGRFVKDKSLSSVAIVAACKDRSETVGIALQSWLRLQGVTEIIVLDWSSNPPIYSGLPQESLSDNRLFLAEAPGQVSWSLTRAYNAAIRLATSTYVLKVDCDTKLRPDFLVRHPISEQIFYSGDWRVLMQPSPAAGTGAGEPAGTGKEFVSDNSVHVNGLLYVARAEFLRLGGYDERVTTYGWDDTDLSSRIARTIENRRFNYSLVEHIAHANILRTVGQRRSSLLPAENPLAPSVEIQRNRILLTRLGLPPWGSQSLRLRWNVVRVNNERSPLRMLLYRANTLPSVSELVSEADALDASKRAIRLILLRYGIPLLPKTLSLDFYKLLAAQVGHPEQCAEVALRLYGGCAARLLSLAASRAVTVGNEPNALSISAKALLQPIATLDKRNQTDFGETVLPPWPYATWRTRFIWRQPDIGCTCRFNNVFEFQDLEILETQPGQLSTEPSMPLQHGTKSASIEAANNPSTDIRSLLGFASRLAKGQASGPRRFTGSLLCDVDPDTASMQHIGAVRASLRGIAPSKATKAAVVSSLRNSSPTVLDDESLDLRQVSTKLSTLEFEALMHRFNQPEIHVMIGTWGGTFSATSRIVHHFDRRAKALCAALILYEPEDKKESVENGAIIALVRQVHNMLSGCPEQPDKYVQAYPELAIIMAGLLSVDACVGGVTQVAGGGLTGRTGV